MKTGSGAIEPFDLEGDAARDGHIVDLEMELAREEIDRFALVTLAVLVGIVIPGLVGIGFGVAVPIANWGATVQVIDAVIKGAGGGRGAESQDKAEREGND